MTSQTTTETRHFTIDANGTSMGTYAAVDQAHALDAYARDAGYEDFAALESEHPASPEVTELPTIIDITRAAPEAQQWAYRSRDEVVTDVAGEQLTIYWDDQDPLSTGWAWRLRCSHGGEESGQLDSVADVVSLFAYFAEAEA